MAGQVSIDDKSSEITAARTLIDRLDLHGAVVAMDALHTQREAATKIRAAGVRLRPRGQCQPDDVARPAQGAALEGRPRLDDHTARARAWVQGHWTVEDRLHRVRDVTFDEDRSQAATGASTQVMASLRNTAIAILRIAGSTNIAHALRQHAHDLDRPLHAILAA